MAELPTFDQMKIEAFTTAMRYATRDDFGSHRQSLIDSIRHETIAVLRKAGKGGQPKPDVDADGDVTFEYEHSSFDFRLDIRRDIAGAQFKDLYDHTLAMQIAKLFYTQVIHVLGLHDVDVMTVDFRNVFNLGESSPKNYTVLGGALMPNMRGALQPLVPPEGEIGRVDFKIGWDYDERHTCYFSIECPGNEDNTTLWTTLNLRTREDIVVSVDQQKTIEDIDSGYRVYCGAYAATVKPFLAGLNLNMDRRQLLRS